MMRTRIPVNENSMSREHATATYERLIRVRSTSCVIAGSIKPAVINARTKGANQGRRYLRTTHSPRAAAAEYKMYKMIRIWLLLNDLSSPQSSWIFFR